MRGKVGEKFIVGQVPTTAGIVSHLVERSGDMAQRFLVAEITLVEGLASEKVGSGTECGGASLALPGQSGCVVGGCPQGAVVHAGGVGGDVVMRNNARQFQI